jgi:flagellar biosynthesis/type III secretory pathway chaperone
MNELLKILAQFLDCLQLQMTLLEELLVVIAREEDLVVSFSLPEFEKLVTEKDQIVRRVQSAEERRLSAVKKLCFLMAYDARGKSPSLTEFMSVSRAYQRNVAALIDEQTRQSLALAIDAIDGIADQYRSAFLNAQPRIDQNKMILQALARNFKRSISVLESEAGNNKRYNERGKSVAPSVVRDGVSFVRVRA